MADIFARYLAVVQAPWVPNERPQAVNVQIIFDDAGPPLTAADILEEITRRSLFGDANAPDVGDTVVGWPATPEGDLAKERDVDAVHLLALFEMPLDIYLPLQLVNLVGLPTQKSYVYGDNEFSTYFTSFEVDGQDIFTISPIETVNPRPPIVIEGLQPNDLVQIFNDESEEIFRAKADSSGVFSSDAWSFDQPTSVFGHAVITPGDLSLRRPSTQFDIFITVS